MIFTRESLKQSIKPIIIVLMICALIYFWGNYRKVNVDLTLRPDLPLSEKPEKLDMTVFKDGTEDVAATFSIQMAADRLAVMHLSLQPGTYYMRGIITTTAGTHIVTQTLVVPNDDASIEIYLRE
ncbi:MAG: hypothetical protein IJM59_00440 [Proteobacteria bacterium]|nr:hypothetical protein [Pseudomonadota bacterium]